MADTWMYNAGKPCCGGGKYCGMKCGACDASEGKKSLWARAGRVFDDNGVWELHKIEGSDVYWQTQAIPYQSNYVATGAATQDGQSSAPYVTYGPGKTYYKYIFRCARGGGEEGFFLQMIYFTKAGFDQFGDWGPDGPGIVGVFEGGPAGSSDDFFTALKVRDQQPVGDLRTASVYRPGLSISRSTADGVCINVDFEDVDGPKTGDAWKVDPASDYSPIVREAPPKITTKATVVIHKQNALCCQTMCYVCPEFFYSTDGRIEDESGVHDLRLVARETGDSAVVLEYQSDVIHADSKSVAKAFWANCPTGAVWGPPFGPGTMAYSYTLRCYSVGASMGGFLLIVNFGYSMLGINSTFCGQYAWTIPNEPGYVGPGGYWPELPPPNPLRQPGANIVTTGANLVATGVSPGTMECDPFTAEFSIPRPQVSGFGGFTVSGPPLPMSRAKVTIGLYDDDRLIVCGIPLSLPQKNLTLSWKNSSIGDGSVTMRYDGNQSWISTSAVEVGVVPTGLVDAGKPAAVLFGMSCSLDGFNTLFHVYIVDRDKPFVDPTKDWNTSLGKSYGVTFRAASSAQLAIHDFNHNPLHFSWRPGDNLIVGNNTQPNRFLVDAGFTEIETTE